MSAAADAPTSADGPQSGPAGGAYRPITRTAPTAAEAAGLARVLQLAARRLERNGLQPTGRVRLERISHEEVAALSGLLGTRWRAPLAGATATVDLAALDRALQDSRYACSLAAAAQAAAGGRLVDRRAQRAAAFGERERTWAALHDHPALDRYRALHVWLERERISGAATRAGGGSPFGVLAAALDVIALLPADPPQTLARFASATCGGDPHALDRGRPLDAAVRRGLAHLDGDSDDADGAEARRARYDRWGIGCDELSSTVLCLGLRPSGDSRLATSLQRAASTGEPQVLTLRELRGVDVLKCGPQAFCCENPDVVAASADELGAACPPLICTSGWPSTTCLRLLRAVVAGGATVRHHGDMDTDGLRILDRVLAITGGRPWRMSADDHALHAATGEPVDVGRVAVSHPGLAEVAAAIVASGRAVREEQTIAVLLADLARVAGGRSVR